MPVCYTAQGVYQEMFQISCGKTLPVSREQFSEIESFVPGRDLQSAYLIDSG